MANELLAGYETVKSAGGSGKKTPIVKISEQAGTYLKGVFLSKKTYKDGEGKERMIANFRLIETTAPMIMKTNAGYAPVADVPAGSEVTVYGPPTRLERLLNSIEADGSQEVLIVYEGKKKEQVRGKNMNVHTFKVGRKPTSANTSADESGVPD